MVAVAVSEPRPRYPRPRDPRPHNNTAGVAPPPSTTSGGQLAAGGAPRSSTSDRRLSNLDPRTSSLEPRPSVPPLSEATLSRLWAGQRFPASALVTGQGAPLRVLRPGRRGRGPGPDFRDALIAAPSGRLLRGDVELHVRAKDFRRHGHHRDARYNGIVLHVVFEDDDAHADETLLASGRRVPVVALSRWTRRRADELAAWLAAPLLWREPCHDALARLGREGVEEALERLGDLRFQERTASLAEAIDRHGASEALYRALLDSAGYGGEKTQSLSVAERLTWQELSARLDAPEGAEDIAEALLLGAAGLLPSQRGAPRAAAHESALERRSSGLASSGRSPPAPAISPRRPANHPARRLAGVARLLVRHRALLDGGVAAEEQMALPTAELIAAWTVEANGYWRCHIAPCIAAKQSPGALIGRSRAIELLTNAVLPWAAAVAAARGESPSAATSCFHTLPRPGRYGSLAFLEANLKQNGVPLPVNARRQQGLLALYKTECTQGGCGRCPLS